MTKLEEKWRSVDVVTQNGEPHVLQQRVYVIYNGRGDEVYTEPGRRHRCKRLDSVL